MRLRLKILLLKNASLIWTPLWRFNPQCSQHLGYKVTSLAAHKKVWHHYEQKSEENVDGRQIFPKAQTKTQVKLLELSMHRMYTPLLCPFCEFAISASSSTISGLWYQDETDLPEYVCAAATSVLCFEIKCTPSAQNIQKSIREPPGDTFFFRDEAREVWLEQRGDGRD